MTKELPIIPPDRADDLHHLQYADSADLLLFMAGNQFMIMEELLAAFQVACDVVEPGEKFDQRHKINYYVCQLTRGPHPDNAQKFIHFICSSAAQQIYKKSGFILP